MSEMNNGEELFYYDRENDGFITKTQLSNFHKGLKEIGMPKSKYVPPTVRKHRNFLNSQRMFLIKARFEQCASFDEILKVIEENCGFKIAISLLHKWFQDNVTPAMMAKYKVKSPTAKPSRLNTKPKNRQKSKMAEASETAKSEKSTKRGRTKKTEE